MTGEAESVKLFLLTKIKETNKATAQRKVMISEVLSVQYLSMYKTAKLKKKKSTVVTRFPNNRFFIGCELNRYLIILFKMNPAAYLFTRSVIIFNLI